MAYATQHAHHHSKTMVQGYRNAQTIFICELHHFGNKISVIQDIEMGQGCAFWKAGCTTGELDVDRVIRLQQCPNGLHLLQ